MTKPVSFDVEAAIGAYLDAHAAECRILDCVPDQGPWLILALPAATLFALWLFVAGGLAARSRQLAERLARRLWVQDALFAVPLALTVLAFQAPVRLWLRPPAGGLALDVRDAAGKPLLAPPTPMDRLGDLLASAAWWILAAAIAVPLALAIIRRFPRSYWIAPALAAMAFLAMRTFEQPFARLTPLPGGALHADLADIARSSGQPASKMLFGEEPFLSFRPLHARALWWRGAPRAVLGQGLYNVVPMRVDQLRPAYRPVTAAEVRAIAGHELAHLRLRHLHVLPLLWVGYAGMLAWLASLGARRATEFYRRRGRLSGPDDAAAFPLAALMLLSAALLFVPLRGLTQLAAETHADAVGLDTARDPDGAAAVALRSARGGRLEAPLLERIFFEDHPSPKARIRRAMEWKARNIPGRWRANGLSGSVTVRPWGAPTPIS